MLLKDHQVLNNNIYIYKLMCKLYLMNLLVWILTLSDVPCFLSWVWRVYKCVGTLEEQSYSVPKGQNRAWSKLKPCRRADSWEADRSSERTFDYLIHHIVIFSAPPSFAPLLELLTPFGSLVDLFELLPLSLSLSQPTALSYSALRV